MYIHEQLRWMKCGALGKWAGLDEHGWSKTGKGEASGGFSSSVNKLPDLASKVLRKVFAAEGIWVFHEDPQSVSNCETDV